MRRLFKDDKAAVEGLPLELLVICVVIAITVPAIWGFAGMYVREQTENDLRGELEHLRKTIEEVASSEIGNIRIIEMDLSGHPMARIDYVQIGGPMSDSLYVRYSIGGREGSVFHLQGYHVSNISDGDPEMMDISGKRNLMIRRSGKMFMGVEIIEVGLLEEVT